MECSHTVFITSLHGCSSSQTRLRDWVYTHTHTHTHTHTPLQEKVCQPWSKSKMHYLPSTSYCLSIVPKNYLLDAVIRNLWLPKQRKFSARRQKSMSNACLGECREIAQRACSWYLTLCDPMDCGLPGSPVHGIFQARILEWVAISSSRWTS